MSARGLTLRAVVFGLLALFILLPFAQTVLLSFTLTLPREGHVTGAPTLLNYAEVWARPDLRGSILNSLTYVTLNIALCLAAGLPAAYAFARYRFTGDRHVLFALLAFRLTPPVVLSLPVFFLFARFGLVNNPVGIALVHCAFNLPVAIWILESFIAAVPREYDETCFIDGHSLSGFFFKRLIPAIAPGIGVTVFFCFVFSWVEVVLARILTVTAGKPITMAINALYGFRTDIGLVMAMTVVSLIPGVAMIWFVRNHIARGFVIRT
ncbi:carbohydrate ABC transporter permease [Donghicola mangrovi]|uniref:Carbohydrate ABC transporter permease n=1 Tax=Donghicola mangrovi TaxID=2729614 RepID=A0A850Q7Z3_9RHOB|nr:carbohydrate ABC transporter permease [Donghicola mangrovi]NVO25266.1 carbohydrate ABC transporter permease [Donghicola mangrovi]